MTFPLARILRLVVSAMVFLLIVALIPCATMAASEHYYSAKDCDRYMQWSGRAGPTCESMPRVLLLTWQTEDVYERFANEMYWKACYAHAHGFDLINTDSGDWNQEGEWYSDDKLWGWWSYLQKHLELGQWQYDYVFITGGDVLMSEHWLHFPVWAFDTGNYDLSLNDQCYSEWGLNDNAFLFKTSKWSLEFLTAGLAHKGKNAIQADNGGYMEQILQALGAEAEASGKPGYDNKCYQSLLLPEPVVQMLKNPESLALYVQRNKEYSNCFFAELNRLAGPYNNRHSKHVGFNPLLDVSDTSSHSTIPWANCWSHLRDPHYSAACVGNLASDWRTSCFCMHWNGLQKLDEDSHRTVHGSCPDPTFNWELSPHNHVNRKRRKEEL